MPYNEWDDNSTPLPLSLDQIRYELAKRGNMPLRADGSDVPYVASEVPQHYVAQSPPRPSSTATNIPQALADRLGLSAIPQAALSIASGFPAAVAKSMGYESAGQAMQYEPTSRGGMEIAEGVARLPEKITGSTMGFGAVPELWNMRARGITPDDVRVMGANMRRIGNEIVEIPPDFRNAQSGGPKRQNAFGEPTLGVKAEAVASDIGDVMARRQAAGKSTVPYVSDFLPETNTYAVRNTGEGQLLTPIDLPGVVNRDLTNYGQMARVNENALRFNAQTFRDQPIEQFNRYMDEFINPESVPDPIRKGWSKYFAERVQGLFPTATEKSESNEAWSQLIPPEEKNKYKMQFLEDFVAKPENKEIAKASGKDLPSVGEYKARVEAADKWLKGPFTNYVQKFVGTKEDPLLQLAEKGLTPSSPEMLLQESEDFLRSGRSTLEVHRNQAGFPAEGSYWEKNKANYAKLEAVKAEERELSTKQNAIARRLNETNPGEDPAVLSPEFARLSNQVTAKVNEIEKLEKQRENLQLASAYETMSDYSITPTTAGELKKEMTFVESQLFPKLAKTPDEAKMIDLARTGTMGAGIEDAAREYVHDIITGALPIDQISNMSFEKHVSQKAGVRAQVQEAKRIAAKEKINKLNAYSQERVNSTPEYLRFGNANVVEFNKTTPLEEIRKGLSFETEMLDHCIGSGGSGAGRKHFITGETRGHTPIIDPITGEIPTGSSGNDRGYVDSVRKGSTQIASVRDATTGYPAVTIEFKKKSDNKFDLGYVSGYKNKTPESIYRNATRDYLNSRADEIQGTGSELTRYDLYDQKNLTNRTLARMTDKTEHEVSMTQLAELPRFLTMSDLKQAVNGEIVDIPPLPARPSREMLPAVIPDQQIREYLSWINDRYPDLQDRLNQVTEDLSDIDNGRVNASQFGLDEDQFEQFTQHLGRYQHELLVERNRGNRNLALNRDENGMDRLIREEQPNIDRAWEIMTQNYDYENMAPAEIRTRATSLRRDPQAVLGQAAGEFLLNPGFVEGLARQIEEQAAPQETLLREMGNNDLETTLNSSLQRIRQIHGEETFDRVIRITNGINNDFDLTANPERYISELRQDADVYQNEMRSSLLSLADDLETTHRQDWEPAEDPGLALPVPARDPIQADLDQAYNIVSESVRTRHPSIVDTINRSQDTRGNLAYAIRADPPRYGLQNYSLDVVNLIAERIIAEGLANNQTPNERRHPRADQLYQDLLDEIQDGIDEGSFDPTLHTAEDIAQAIIDDQVGGTISDLNATEREILAGEVRRRYDRDEAATVQPQPRLPATTNDTLPAIRQRPMGVNFLSDAIDTMPVDDHTDHLQEMYGSIGDQVEDLSDRTNQQTILRLIREYADYLEEMNDQPAANSVNQVGDTFRDMIIEASRPEGHATGGLIQSFKSGGGVSFADNYDAMRYELLRNQ